MSGIKNLLGGIGTISDSDYEQREQNYLLNLEKTRNNAGVIGKGKVAKIVDMAKAQALESLGEDEATTQLLKQYM